MPTLQYPYKGLPILSAPKIASVRVIDVNVRLGTDVTMGTATDDIVVADLPAGTVVLGVGIEQVAVGTGSGTLVARVGSVTGFRYTSLHCCCWHSHSFCCYHTTNCSHCCNHPERLGCHCCT